MHSNWRTGNRKHLLMEDLVKLGLGWEAMTERVQVLGRDFALLPAPACDDRADVVVSSAVLERKLDQHRVLAQCWAWTKPDGEKPHRMG
jgi:hypothetical protein